MSSPVAPGTLFLTGAGLNGGGVSGFSSGSAVPAAASAIYRRPTIRDSPGQASGPACRTRQSCFRHLRGARPIAPTCNRAPARDCENGSVGVVIADGAAFGHRREYIALSCFSLAQSRAASSSGPEVDPRAPSYGERTPLTTAAPCSLRPSQNASGEGIARATRCGIGPQGLWLSA